MSKLTDKQEAFCLEYLKDLNATQAAIRAGYSESTARSQGQRLLTNVDVQEEIQKLKCKRSEAVKIDANYVLTRLKQIDELDVLDIVNDDMSGFKLLSEWPKEWRISISGMDIKKMLSGGDDPIETVIEKIKWPDKVKNLELIGRHVDVGAWEKEKETNDDTALTKIQIEVVDSSRVDDKNL